MEVAPVTPNHPLEFASLEQLPAFPQDSHRPISRPKTHHGLARQLGISRPFEGQLTLSIWCKNEDKSCQKQWISTHKQSSGASLVAQWLKICLLMQGTRVRALVWEDPTCRRTTRPVSHNYWACTSGACAPQQERPRQWEARAPRWRVAPTCRN